MRSFYVLAVLSFVLNSCADDSVEPEKFRKPIIANGIKYQEGRLYFTDLLGQLITGIDPSNGKIVDQFDFAPIATSPDDLVFMDDGTIYWTSPLQGTIGSIANGDLTVLAQVGVSVNPIERRPGTDLVYFGFENPETSIGSLDHSSGEIDLDVVTGLPPINGFSFSGDGFLYAPMFDFSLIELGGANGGVLRIDVDANTFEQLAITFPDAAGKTSFRATTGIVADGNGKIYVLESFPPNIYRVELSTLEAFRVRSIPTAATDNIAISDDKSVLYVTSFTESVVYEVAVDGSSIRRIPARL